jgi:iron complex transport system ATP-binding protein
VIEVQNLGYRYREGAWVFRDYSFQLDHGRILAVLGPNGRGKTTLLKCLVGILKPAEGKVSVENDCGYVPQHAGSVFAYSVREMVVMGRARHIPLLGTPKPADYRIAEKILEKVGLAGYADRSFLELSGGERQLVLIARALASECRILILDEPASALDFRNQDVILCTLRTLSREQGMTIVFSTHSPHHAVHIADNVMLMQDLDTYRYGSPEDVLRDNHLEALYGIKIRTITIPHAEGSGKAVVPVFR